MNDGSQAHKTLFCQTFLDTHRPFEPADLPWPVLDERSIDRLRSIPFWSVALAAERNAGYMVTAFARGVEDPLIKRALALQGVEETRHANLLAEMLTRYTIEVPDKAISRSPATQRHFIDFGYEECIDSFFGFGIFGLAQQIQLFVPELTDVFEIVLLEEARHVTFFVNWIAYERIRRRRGWRPLQAGATALGYVRAVKRIATTFAPRGDEKKRMQGVGFGAEGAFALFEDVTWRSFLASCVRGHEYYMSAMPSDLIKPSLLPNAARFALAAVPSWKKPASRPSTGTAA
ncbi:MAG: ferritin-like domain-containing protein [Candidatus Eremiobacteraeota bacterium]|nr:ferritin-like domain-containing protein [Candidatus Eremiobacteraeota bacterium]